MIKLLVCLMLMAVQTAVAETYVNQKLVFGYSITYKQNGDIEVNTVPADFDCPNMGGAPWNMGDNFNYSKFHIGYIPFKHTGSGKFTVTAGAKVNAGVSKCPAGFWEPDCGFSANRGTISLSSCTTLQKGKTYYLNVRQPDCDSRGKACPVKVGK